MAKLLFKPPDNSTGEYSLTVVKSLTLSLFNMSIYISMVVTICFPTQHTGGCVHMSYSLATESSCLYNSLQIFLTTLAFPQLINWLLLDPTPPEPN